MNRHLVAYDVKNDPDDQRRKSVRERIAQAFPDGFDHVELSVYLVATPKTASEVYDDLIPLLKQGDRLLVAALTGDAAWTNTAGLRAWFATPR